MSDKWDEMRQAHEEEYFQKINNEALGRLAKVGSITKKNSPITGDPLEHRTVEGINLEHCKKTDGVWIEKDELKTIISQAQTEHGKSWAKKFISSLFGEGS